jgi:hypothetical protein
VLVERVGEEATSGGEHEGKLNVAFPCLWGNLARASLASMPKRINLPAPIPDTSLGRAIVEVTLRTRPGCRSAMRWAITPPSKAPKMCTWLQLSGDRVVGHVLRGVSASLAGQRGEW